MNKVYVADHTKSKKPAMHLVEYENEEYFKISHHDAMRPFFMSIVSDANHWLFISSNGGLTAGRKNPDYALFPYYTDDKISENHENTGSKTIFQIHVNGSTLVWEPFSDRTMDIYAISRNLYKSIYGNKIIFEEINHDLGLTFKYQWNTGKIFGFVRKAELANISDVDYQITLLDGIQNIMPYGVPNELQRSTGNLVDAYKRSELEPACGLGIYALSAIIVDRAEPSEALKANIAWSVGLSNPTYLLSSGQLQRFRQKHAVYNESDIKGERGAYFVSSEITLPKDSISKWHIIANVNQNHSQIIRLCKTIREDDEIQSSIQSDIDSGTKNLIKLIAGADGLQVASDKRNDTRHFTNVMFNIMRGGTFDNDYHIEKEDFLVYLSKANRRVIERNPDFIKILNSAFRQSELKELVLRTGDKDLIRLSIEYLPLQFSRRHGDPSRPWNYFTINTQSEADGSKILHYEGNWRDLFQNWEALAFSYPGFTEGMIFKFLNASTFDGYNPYRVTKDGFDWETIEPDNPWSYIGYWGDHQIIYLLKLLEMQETFYPGSLQSLFKKEWFVYAAVPYIIKPYEAILKNHKDTIEFDHKWDAAIRKQRESLGADGALLASGNHEIYHVNLVEKILATLLAKLSNFIPEAGIWMNTQRPEWNDANNALVGNGISMVTLYHMHRFMKFLNRILDTSGLHHAAVSSELEMFYKSVKETLQTFSHLLTHVITDTERKTIVDRLGMAASAYRHQIYTKGFQGAKGNIAIKELKVFIQICLDFTEHSIRANQRSDKLFHAYNLINVTETGISYARLGEMLEGQVAALSSGYLDPGQSLDVLDALNGSALFREDQQSYILYPNKQLPGFLRKNNIQEVDVQSSELIKRLVADGNTDIVEQDILGGLHFNGNFQNAADLEKALHIMAGGPYNILVEKERTLLLDIFEKVFNHKAFTGRSGTFFAYEGLGSIYWHMVSKLLLAVQECCLKAVDQEANPAVVGRLLYHYHKIQEGIGVHKPPELYGAFPTDPYSHTPMHRGAQQPGMTGQVKEDILTRFGELGVFIKEGKLMFAPYLLRKQELLSDAKAFVYEDIKGTINQIELSKGQLAFTFCGMPVIYSLSDSTGISVYYANGTTEKIKGPRLNSSISSMIFHRTGEINRLEVSVVIDR